MIMAKTITVSLQKGGVGKSTSALNLGAVYGEWGSQILLCDIDPHAGLTKGLGFEPLHFHKTMYQVLLEHCSLQEAIIETTLPNVSLCPANIHLSGAEVELTRGSSLVGADRILADVLAEIQEHYDLIFIDCPPSLNILTINALVAADFVLIPIQCEKLALDALDDLLPLVEKVTQKVKPTLETIFVRTMFNTRTLHSKEVSDILEKRMGTQVLPTIIKRAVAFADATIAGESILQFAPHSKGAGAYRQLAMDLKKYLHI